MSSVDGALNQLNASTRRFIARKAGKLVDQVFHHDALWAYTRQSLREDFDGGSRIGEDFIYRGLIGGAYLKGKEFNIEERQIEQQAQFLMKFLEVNVTLSKEDIQVLNTGPNASYRLVDTRVSGAYMTMGAFSAIGLYLNGINANYTANVNGLAEALNDGTTVSWDGNTYADYGGLSRTGTSGGQRLVSAPTSVAGPIEYDTLENTYGDCSYGPGRFEPNLGVVTNKGYSYIKTKFQTQQRFNDTQDPKIGFNGLQFNGATLIKSRYCPGSFIADSTTDAYETASDYLTQTTNGAVTTYPSLNLASSETLFWINARNPWMNFYLTKDPEFSFGFTGWKGGQGNTKVAGQVLASYNVSWFPRYHRQVHGFTS
jgi:hypothetical protein